MRCSGKLRNFRDFLFAGNYNRYTLQIAQGSAANFSSFNFKKHSDLRTVRYFASKVRSKYRSKTSEASDSLPCESLSAKSRTIAHSTASHSSIIRLVPFQKHISLIKAVFSLKTSPFFLFLIFYNNI